MFVIISPARTIRRRPFDTVQPTRPALLSRTRRLADILRGYSPWELESILRCNPKLAMQAFEAYQQFSPEGTGSPALLSYHGIAYSNLNPESFTPEDLSFAGEHLRILSAFYGVLRPTDSLQPYRLELVSRLKVDGENLYGFWGSAVRDELFSTAAPVINLCSGEYTKLVAPHLKAGDVFLSCRFLEERRGKLRCFATGSKEARGQMARYIVRNRLEKPGDLWGFHWGDYQFSPSLSSDNEYVFTR